MNRDLAYLQHILECIDLIFEYTEEGKDDFISNQIIKDAVIRNFQVIGEATKKLSSELISENKDVPWSKMAKFRDKIIHDYIGINYYLVWDVVEKELPKIKPYIVALVED